MHEKIFLDECELHFEEHLQEVRMLSEEQEIL